ncbi:hypothetical protein ACVI1T_004660, partial [Rhizobium redzepovicii]
MDDMRFDAWKTVSTKVPLTVNRDRVCDRRSEKVH